MRGILPFLAAVLQTCEAQFVFTDVSNVRALDCQWGLYGPWSECNGCTKTQIRRRGFETFAQFGGAECSGSAYETRACVPTESCPLEAGCGERFKCASGQCLSKSLVCNGDHDCHPDGSDEQNCDKYHNVCDIHKYVPNTELTGAGFDILTQERTTSNVIHTTSYGGQCRKVFSDENREYYRLSDNVLSYTFKVDATKYFTSEFYNSSWSYKKSTESQVTSNYGESANQKTDFTYDKNKSYQLLVIRNSVEVGQFINKNAEHLTLAEPFWRELVMLPTVYHYGLYRSLIDKYGTHFLQSGTLGGEYEFRFYLDSKKIAEKELKVSDMSKCSSRNVGLIFVSYSSSECQKASEVIKSSSDSNGREVTGQAILKGGDPALEASLRIFNLDKLTENQDRYSQWADSVSRLPTIINYKLTPLSELVKEVPCAAVKKVLLKRAIEQYIQDEHPCHCKPCLRNGLPVRKGKQCVCYCKPHTYGIKCQRGDLAGDNPDAVDGSWSCWSSWSTCYGTSGRRVRYRTCNNPEPKNGGNNCIGDSAESQMCAEDELEYLRTVSSESHCFDPSTLPTRFCPSPPALANGYIVDEDKSFHVGKRVVYGCNAGYTMVGLAFAECMEDQTWRMNMQCTNLLCFPPPPQYGMVITPQNRFYLIGEKVRFSCQLGMNLKGPALSECKESTTWSPDIKDIHCAGRPITQPKCKPWENIQDFKCICKRPEECGSSLDVCAHDGGQGWIYDPRIGNKVALTVCKMKVLECQGHKYTLTKDEACTFPSTTERSCDSCHLWETCSDETNKCVCREAGTCQEKGLSICVKVNGVRQTLSECDAGILRCRGQKVEIVSTIPCMSR